MYYLYVLTLYICLLFLPAYKFCTSPFFMGINSFIQFIHSFIHSFIHTNVLHRRCRSASESLADYTISVTHELDEQRTIGGGEVVGHIAQFSTEDGDRCTRVIRAIPNLQARYIRIVHLMEILSSDWLIDVSRVQHNGMSPRGIIVARGLRPRAKLIPRGDIPLCCTLDQSPFVLLYIWLGRDQ